MDFLKSDALNLEPILGEMRDRWNDYIFEPILRRKIEGILSLEGREFRDFTRDFMFFPRFDKTPPPKKKWHNFLQTKETARIFSCFVVLSLFF